MKNAHIIPHFLIKTATNEDGSTERDRELVFSIGSTDFVDVFFGRDISVEKIVEMQGKEMSDQQIEEQVHPFTMDNVICRTCEKKLSILEGYVADQIYAPMNEGARITKSTLKSGRACYELSSLQNSLYDLLVYSIFWRCSVAQFNGFRLHQKVESTIREYLNDYLNLDIEEVKRKFARGNSQIYPIISTFSEKDEDYDTTGNLIIALKSRFPYFVIANNMTFQLFEKEKQIKASVQHLYGLYRIISRSDYLDFNSAKNKVAILSVNENKQIVGNIYQEKAQDKNQFFRSAFNRMHKSIFHLEAPIELVQIFFRMFIFDETPLAARYTRENFIKCVYNSYIEFGYIPK